MKAGKGTMSAMIVPVWISAKDNPETEHLVYALLDTQSDTTFVLEETANALNSRYETAKLQLSTMSARDNPIICKRFKELEIRSFDKNVTIDLPDTYSRDFIPTDRSHIPTSSAADKWPHLRRISHLIPPMQKCEVGLLIGYNCPLALAPRNCITGHGNQPFAIQTDLGWSMVGGTDPREDCDHVGVSHRIVVKGIQDPLQPLTNNGEHREDVRFVDKTTVKEVMNIPPAEIIRILESDFTEDTRAVKTMSQDDIMFLSKVATGIHQQQDGHYSMPLPFRTRPCLPDNRRVAMRRAEHLERRFRSNYTYHQDYKAFMEEMLERGDAEKIPLDELDHKPSWYIPHHGIYHPNKPDKIRVVFDCSAKCQGTSLNDHLLQGPDMTNGLTGVLIRFREERVAFMCDVEKMFHQFRVDTQDRNYLRFLWMGEDYRMTVHLFGASSSPACANYGLKQIANDYGKDSSGAAHFVRRNFYVDDGLTSVDSIDKAKTLIRQTREMCAKGNLRVHKFVSNSIEVLESVPCSKRATDLKDLDLSLEYMPVERALGIQWCVESDCFQFRLTLKDRPCTRRGILSTVASIYDPLGFLAPFVLIGKQILQTMCMEHAEWDQPIGDELRPRWEKWKGELCELLNLKISRCILPDQFGTVEQRELHHFSDASTTGYGQCTYLRLIDDAHKVHCSFVMGKSRVTPLRVVTVPRLELQAAIISVKISDFLKQEMEHEGTPEYFWTDSKVVLGYISNEARRFHVYVANRVQRIRESSDPSQWRYVATGENPADHASRGLGADELIASNWFSGPSFLWENDLHKEEINKEETLMNDPEVKGGHCHLLETKEEKTMIERLDKFSDWSRAVIGIAALQQLIRRKTNRNKTDSTRLTTDDKSKARTTIIKMVQGESFIEEIKELTDSRNDEAVKFHSQLYKLDPFLHKDGTMRVGGRLKHASSLHYDVKHPIILPRRSYITNLIVKDCHEKVEHQGRGMTVNEIRARGFWVVGISSAVSSHIHRCVQCKKLRAQTLEQKMANLPEERVEPSAPFTFCGYDCFGPFIIKEGRKELKKYGLLFTCMSSRAVHIEALDDMSTDAFLNALRCFIALRGPVRQLRSDQGSNFIGAHNELAKAFKEITDDRVRRYLEAHGCDVITNVPSASHMGGVWERQIRTVRNVLTAILTRANSRLDSSSLRTFFYEAMAIVNSRPLAIDNLNDPCGPEALTPNHLLTMKSRMLMPPPGKFQCEDVYARKRWRRVQYLADQFWSRWKKEYLANLQMRQKWNRKQRNLRIGDIVLLKDEDLVRCHWRLAKVVGTMASEDNLVRKVKLLIPQSLAVWQKSERANIPRKAYPQVGTTVNKSQR